MELSPCDRLEIGTELRRAADAIAAGNDGKARVCARRAAGVALRAWHRSRGTAGAPADAQSLLKFAASDNALPAGAREAAARLSASVAGFPGAGRPGAGQPEPGRPEAGRPQTGTADAARPFSIDPLADASIVMAAVESSLSGAAGTGADPSATRDV
jgi:hypothetical protein